MKMTNVCTKTFFVIGGYFYVKSEIKSLANGCHSGQFECTFDLEV